MKNSLLYLLEHHVKGNSIDLHKWILMFCEIIEKKLPSGLVEYQKKFYMYQKELSLHIKNTSLKMVEENLNQLLISHPMIQKNTNLEYYIQAKKNNNNAQEFFFIIKDYSYNPIFFMRNKTELFLQQYEIKKEIYDELLIGVTEAIENAIKYTNHSLIYIEHTYEIVTNEYRLIIANSIEKTNNQIDTSKYTERKSLMRGILIMSKIFDNITTNRNEDLEYFLFTAFKKIK